MAFEGQKHSKTYLAGTTIPAFCPVAYIGNITAGSAQAAEKVWPVGSSSFPVLGVARASAAAGQPVTVNLPHSYVKCVAVASVGAGALVGVASLNGAVGLIAVGGASAIKYTVGTCEQPAAAADIFTVLLNPQNIV